ncbi:MAG: ABC transporter permease [Sphingobacteriaceae bacterium]|nr:ABC transporter permease [Sphingobacteriaceae bacterium]
MLRNYFKTAFRNLLRHKLFSAINILGLALGIATAFLIVNYVSHEFNYDSFHIKKDRIYRVESQFYEGTNLTDDWATSSFGYGSAMKKDFPEIEDVVRIGIHRTEQVVRYKDLKIRENKIAYTEPAFFKLFDYNLLQGDRITALKRPNTVVITETAAKRFFMNESPIGKTLRFASGNRFEDCEVTGIIEDFPANSHISFDYLISYEGLSAWTKDTWYLHEAYTYVLLHKGANTAKLEAAFPQLAEKHKHGDSLRKKRWSISLVPISDIHLNPQKSYETETKGSKSSLITLIIIAVLILLSAWINYINLVTARSMERAKEVGIRKVSGATRMQLIWQYFIESGISNMLALVLAAIIILFSYPYFTHLIGKEIGIVLFSKPTFWLSLSAVVILGIWLSGFYPALIMSAIKPALILKGKFSGSQKGSFMQKGLLVFQFSAALFLVIGMFVVQRQLKYMHEQQLGVDIERTIVMKFPVSSSNLKESVEQFAEKLRTFSNIKAITITGAVPGLEVAKFASNSLYGSAEKNTRLYEMLTVDYDYVRAFDMKLVAGRSFVKGFGNEIDNILINEESLKQLGFATAKQALGKKIMLEGEETPAEIIGVVKNWHQRGLSKSYTPIMMILNGKIGWVPAQYIAVRVVGKNLSSTMDLLKNNWQSTFPESSFDAFFLDSFFNEQYVAELNFEKVTGFFTALAIFITMLGLWALSAYTAVKKTKEIGIRKVFGAGINHILLLFSKKMLQIFVIAFCITVPLSWFIMNEWLSGFAFHTQINFLTFIYGGLAIVGISLITVIWQSWNVAVQTPVKSLRTE